MIMDNHNLRLITLGCFRYSLGRKTYMPKVTIQFINEHKEIFTQQDWKSFIKEIQECNDLGMECDKTEWKRFLIFCHEQLKKEKLK